MEQVIENDPLVFQELIRTQCVPVSTLIWVDGIHPNSWQTLAEAMEQLGLTPPSPAECDNEPAATAYEGRATTARSQRLAALNRQAEQSGGTLEALRGTLTMGQLEAALVEETNFVLEPANAAEGAELRTGADCIEPSESQSPILGEAEGVVEYQLGGKGPFVEAKLHVTGDGKLTVEPTGYLRGGAAAVTADLTLLGTAVGEPKTPRSGRPFCLRVDTVNPPQKFVFDTGNATEQALWRTCLRHARVAALAVVAAQQREIDELRQSLASLQQVPGMMAEAPCPSSVPSPVPVTSALRAGVQLAGTIDAKWVTHTCMHQPLCRPLCMI